MSPKIPQLPPESLPANPANPPNSPNSLNFSRDPREFREFNQFREFGGLRWSPQLPTTSTRYPKLEQLERISSSEPLSVRIWFPSDSRINLERRNMFRHPWIVADQVYAQDLVRPNEPIDLEILPNSSKHLKTNTWPRSSSTRQDPGTQKGHELHRLR